MLHCDDVAFYVVDVQLTRINVTLSESEESTYVNMSRVIKVSNFSRKREKYQLVKATFTANNGSTILLMTVYQRGLNEVDDVCTFLTALLIPTKSIFLTKLACILLANGIALDY